MAKLRIARAQQTRRRFLGVAGAAAIAPLAVPGAAADARYSFRLSLYNVHNGEDVDAVFWEEGRFLPQAVERFEQLLRDWRTGDIGRFDPRLLLQLSNMAAIMGNWRAVPRRFGVPVRGNESGAASQGCGGRAGPELPHVRKGDRYPPSRRADTATPRRR